MIFSKEDDDSKYFNRPDIWGKRLDADNRLIERDIAIEATRWLVLIAFLVGGVLGYCLHHRLYHG